VIDILVMNDVSGMNSLGEGTQGFEYQSFSFYPDCDTDEAGERLNSCFACG